MTKIFAFLTSVFLLFSINITMLPSRGELLSITVFSPCGRADEEKRGLLSLLLNYQKENWRRQIWATGIKIDANLGLDSSYFRIISLKNFWSTASKITSSLIYDSQIAPAVLARAKNYMSLNLPKPTIKEFAPFLFYPSSDYAKPYPEVADIMRASPKDVLGIKRKCFSPNVIKIVVEGNFIPSLINNTLVKKKNFPYEAKLAEPPDKPALGYGFLQYSETHVIWFFKIIEDKEIYPIKLLIHSLTRKPDGLLYSVLPSECDVKSGIMYGRNVSFGWIDIKGGSLNKIFLNSSEVLKEKMKGGINMIELGKIKRYMKGREGFEESLPWQGMRSQWEKFNMEGEEESLHEVNRILSSFPLRSVTVLFTGKEDEMKGILEKVNTIGVLNERGKFLYELSKE